MSLFLLPLLASPVLAATLGVLASRLVRTMPKDDCACVIAPVPVASAGDGMLANAMPVVLIAPDQQCRDTPGLAARFSLTRAAGRAHVVSAAAICFARGVNDTPKLAALLIAGQVLDAVAAAITIAVVMAAGGLFYARRVAITMSQRVTRMDHAQGLAANLITAALVLFASKLGLPISTTHVSVGSIAGIGAGVGSIDWPMARNIVLSWVVTLPVAAALAWLAAVLIFGS